MDDFTKAYLVAALWSSTDNSDPETGGDPLDKNYNIDDIAPEALAAAIEDCRVFQEANAADLQEAYSLYQITGDWTPQEQAGHDYWLTRCGHGVGFWDRGIGAVGKRLTDAAHSDGSRDLYVGDDGLIYGF